MSKIEAYVNKQSFRWKKQLTVDPIRAPYTSLFSTESTISYCFFLLFILLLTAVNSVSSLDSIVIKCCEFDSMMCCSIFDFFSDYSSAQVLLFDAMIFLSISLFKEFGHVDLNRSLPGCKLKIQ